MAVTGDSPEKQPAALLLTVMARPTRHGRPRRSPPSLFFKLIAVGLRPIDRHPTPACPAVHAARGGPAAGSKFS